MVSNFSWRRELGSLIIPRLGVAHADLTRMAAALRNSVGVDIWTESPSDQTKLTSGKTHFSLEGWRTHYRQEYQTLNSWNAANGANLQLLDPSSKTALDGYLSSMLSLGASFSSVMSGYSNANGRLIQTLISQADRDLLAAAIEAQLS